MCKVGQHDCKPESRDEKRSGEKWFCCNCNEQFTNQNKVNKCRNVFFKGFERDEIQMFNDEIIKVKIAKLKECAKRDEYDQIEIDDSDEEEQKEDTDKEKKNVELDNKIKNKQKEEENKKNEAEKTHSEKNGRETVKNKNGNSGASGNGHDNDNNNKKNCYHFMNRACKFGKKIVEIFTQKYARIGLKMESVKI